MSEVMGYKVGDVVKARTVFAEKMVKGEISDVRPGPKGTWYSVKTDDGQVINTRAACIKPA